MFDFELPKMILKICTRLRISIYLD